MLLVALISLVVTQIISQNCPNTTDTTPDHCPYFNNRYLNRTIPTLSSDSNCHWYRPYACCTPTEAHRLVAGLADDIFVGATEDCLDLLNMLVCFVCSPNQSLFYAPGELVICRDFCGRIFSSCSSAVWKGYTLGSYFDNSSHFCNSRGYTMEDSTNLSSCFNAANRIDGSICTLFTCLFISFLLMPKFSWKILILFLLLFSAFQYGEADHPEKDVKTWAESLGNFTQNITWHLLQVNSTQNTFHSATYEQLIVNGSQLRDEMADQLSSVYQEASRAVRTLVSRTEQLFNGECTNTAGNTYSLDELWKEGLFYDSDTRIFRSDTNSSSVKISDSVDRNQLSQEIALTANLTDTFISAKKGSQYISRLYFGSVKGFLREFPGREWERDIIGFPKEYDPRLQNWYHAASSRPKDIVIIIDCSSSMLDNDRWQLALSTIELLLQTLTQEDFINIICSASSAYLNQESSTPEYIEARVMSSCSPDSLMPATSGVKQHLMETMGREQPIGGSDHRDAFTLAFKLLWNQVSVSSRMCEPLILFLTDGQDTDPVLCRPAAYFGTEEGALFVPGPNCLYNFNELYQHINLLESDYITNKSRSEIRIIGFAITDTATTLPYNVSCSHGGFGIKITDRLAIYSQLSPYFDYINQNSTGIEFLNPYGGRDGQLILTAVSPVYKQCGGGRTLVGVVGVDYSLSAVQAVLSRARADGSYAFIINQFGEALFHPRIDPIARLIPNPIYPPLSSLENCPNTSNISICSTNYNITNIESMIMRASSPTGDFIVPSVPRLALRGDHQDGVEWTLGNSNYFYTPIANTSFFLGLNLADTFLTQSVLVSRPPNESYSEPYYTIFSEYPRDTKDTFGLQPPNFCVTTPFNVSTNQSLVTLAPISVCDSSNFPSPPTVYQYFSTYRNPDLTDSFEGCSTETEVFRERVLSSILLTSPIGVRWQSVLTDGVTWRYIGLENGILRIFPGVTINTAYNPTLRPWYRRAVAEKKRLAISYVYLDAGGAGKTVTLSRAIFKSPQILNATNCSYSGCQCTKDTECDNLCIPELKVCSTDRIAGVTGFDFTYTEFSKTIHEHLDSLHFSDFCKITKCSFYIFDSQTFIILADEILNASPYDTAEYQRVSLGTFQPEIVRDLVDRKGLLIEEVSFDFQSRCFYSDLSSPAREADDSLFDKTGKFPSYQNEYSCLQTVRNFYINETLLASLDGTVIGVISSNNCRNGKYYVSAIPGTNAFLLVLNDSIATEECAIDRTAISGPTLNLTGGTQCASLFSAIQLTASYNCSTPIYTPPCQPASGGVCTLASSILIGLLFFLLCM